MPAERPIIGWRRLLDDFSDLAGASNGLEEGVWASHISAQPARVQREDGKAFGAQLQGEYRREHVCSRLGDLVGRVWRIGSVVLCEGVGSQVAGDDNQLLLGAEGQQWEEGSRDFLHADDIDVQRFLPSRACARTPSCSRIWIPALLTRTSSPFPGPSF